jgi:hypothetical protein
VYDFKEMKKTMKTASLHISCKSLAQMGGFVPSYWLAIDSISNDRTPELLPGSVEMLV